MSIRPCIALVLLLPVFCAVSQQRPPGVEISSVTMVADTPTGGDVPFTVRDSISRLIILDPTGRRTARASGPINDIALRSPDGSAFVLRARRGDVVRDVLIESLLLFQTTDVEQALKRNASSNQPPSRELVAVEIRNGNQLLSSVQWISSREIGYIAPDVRDIQQIFSVNVADGKTRQLTSSETNIVGFGASVNKLVYYRVAPDQRPSAIHVDQALQKLLFLDEDAFHKSKQLVAQDRQTGETRLLPLAPFLLMRWHLRVWVSPDGSHAVATVPAASAPLGSSSDRAAPSQTVPGKAARGFSPADAANTPRLVQVDLQNGSVRPVADVASAQAAEQKGSVLQERNVSRAAAPGEHGVSRSFNIQQIEGINRRPKVYATGGECRCTRQIFDPEPSADRYRFGVAEMISWVDRNGRRWTGELVRPTDFQIGHRYPLVIQTHGVLAGEFLVDGPEGITSAMAAQPLANAGFLVLQVDESGAGAITGDAREPKLVAEGYRAGIASLIDQGLVDAKKVGLVAFSRTGLHAMQLLADHPHLLAAFVTADAPWWGYVNYVAFLPFKDRVSQEVRRLTSVPRIGTHGLDIFEKQDPLYAASNARAAIRIEANSRGSLLSYWELFARLRASSRPVDLVYFPRGSHVLHMPGERLASQGGTLDWFRFWLQGYEDPDSGKQDQYVRWRALREKRDAKVGQLRRGLLRTEQIKHLANPPRPRSAH